MWISTKAQYGLRALIEIAAGGGAPTALKNVAEKQEISQHYLEQIAAALRRAGFIRSVRGAHGGYRLARPAEAITALEVVEAMEGSLAPVSCLDDPGSCGHTGDCATENLWRRVDVAVRTVLAATTLNDLIHETEFLHAARRLSAAQPQPEAARAPRA
jgi:Rrf2 family protein